MVFQSHSRRNSGCRHAAERARLGALPRSRRRPTTPSRDSLHNQLLSRIDLNVMGTMKPDRLREELGLLVERLLLETGGR